MNLNDLANLGQIIGAVAVVISLFYVALQIQQNTNVGRSPTAQTVHVRRACVTTDRFPKRTEFALSQPFMAFLSYSQNAFLKWRAGLLASPLWLGW
jgi:hypothetical protein